MSNQTKQYAKNVMIIVLHVQALMQLIVSHVIIQCLLA